MNNRLQRGNLLWEGSRMFLPEHKRALLEHRKTISQPDPPHPPDEQQLEAWHYIVDEAIATGRTVRFTLFQNGFFTEQKGQMIGISTERIQCQSITGDIFSIRWQRIAKIEWA
ncbi:YolD-like family protein [Bacillaceae bacterium SIJ1]|uniref:YolD-like family protein n=1 Tax=Litoribacterium kuwaitense TaxID=1398745 RepID=UPI0013ECD767|nr:YolD-like family protein [Litoribacterium kuwaitense]NGP44752.1 YolD-like family protein [Litoribacterium kuwaitense]